MVSAVDGDVLDRLISDDESVGVVLKEVNSDDLLRITLSNADIGIEVSVDMLVDFTVRREDGLFGDVVILIFICFVYF